MSGSPELIMKSVAQMNGISGPVHLEDADLVSLEAAPPAKRGRKRWLYILHFPKRILI